MRRGLALSAAVLLCAAAAASELDRDVAALTGRILGETTIPSIPPGASVMVTVDIGALNRTVVIWVIADPEDLIEECNDANNRVQGPELACSMVVR